MGRIEGGDALIAFEDDGPGVRAAEDLAALAAVLESGEMPEAPGGGGRRGRAWDSPPRTAGSGCATATAYGIRVSAGERGRGIPRRAARADSGGAG